MIWQRVFLSRFVVVPALIAAAVVAWNIYVDQHARGVLSGRVIDGAGQPVAGATVVLWAHDFVTQVETARTTTDAAGDFRFADNASHLIQLQALAGKMRRRG